MEDKDINLTADVETESKGVGTLNPPPLTDVVAMQDIYGASQTDDCLDAGAGRKRKVGAVNRPESPTDAQQAATCLLKRIKTEPDDGSGYGINCSLGDTNSIKQERDAATPTCLKTEPSSTTICRPLRWEMSKDMSIVSASSQLFTKLPKGIASPQLFSGFRKDRLIKTEPISDCSCNCKTEDSWTASTGCNCLNDGYKNTPSELTLTGLKHSVNNSDLGIKCKSTKELLANCESYSHGNMKSHLKSECDAAGCVKSIANEESGTQAKQDCDPTVPNEESGTQAKQDCDPTVPNEESGTPSEQDCDPTVPNEESGTQAEQDTPTPMEVEMARVPSDMDSNPNSTEVAQKGTVRVSTEEDYDDEAATVTTVELETHATPEATLLLTEGDSESDPGSTDTVESQTAQVSAVDVIVATPASVTTTGSESNTETFFDEPAQTRDAGSRSELADSDTTLIMECFSEVDWNMEPETAKSKAQRMLGTDRLMSEFVMEVATVENEESGTQCHAEPDCERDPKESGTHAKQDFNCECDPKESGTHAKQDSNCECDPTEKSRICDPTEDSGTCNPTEDSRTQADQDCGSETPVTMEDDMAQVSSNMDSNPHSTEVAQNATTQISTDRDSCSNSEQTPMLVELEECSDTNNTQMIVPTEEESDREENSTDTPQQIRMGESDIQPQSNTKAKRDGFESSNRTGKRYSLRTRTAKQYKESPDSSDDQANGTTSESLEAPTKRRRSSVKCLQCPECGLEYSLKSSLIQHMKYHHRNTAFFHVGSSPLSSQTDLKEHMKTHTNDTSIPCHKHSISFGDSKDSEARTGKRHSFPCPKCEASFSSQAGLTQHSHKHSADKAYSCCVCSAYFTYADKLGKHMQIHCAENPYSCLVCNVSFGVSRKLMHIHMMQIHTEKASSHYQCDQCSGCFTKKSSLSVHVQKVHSPAKQFSCQVCDLQFSLQDDLESHMVQHFRKTKITCSECDLVCSSVLSLKQHMKHHVIAGKETILEKTTAGQKNVQCSPETRSCLDTSTKAVSIETICADSGPNITETVGVATVENEECGTQCHAEQDCDPNHKPGTQAEQDCEPNQESGTQTEQDCDPTQESRKWEKQECDPKESATQIEQDCDPNEEFHDEEDINNLSEESVYSCKVCDANFSCKRSLKHHMLRMHRSYKAAIDQTSVPSRDCIVHKEKSSRRSQKNRSSHRTQGDMQCTKRYECSKCNMIFDTSKVLQKHIKKRHAFVKSLSCPDCEERFFTTADLTQHMTCYHRGSSSYQICIDVFSKSSSTNVDREDPSHGNSFSCKECSADFSDSKALAVHRMRKHSSIRPFKCSDCKASYCTKGELDRHGLNHTGEIFSCSVCSAYFKQHSYLKTHMKIHSNDRKLYFCKECQASFHYTSTLKKHIKRHSESETKPYQCKQCSKTFADSNRLSVHSMRKHRSDRPFQCSDCKAGYCTIGELRRHRFSHDNKNLYACSQCSATFQRPDYLRKHMNVHSGLKPYSCKACQASFHYPSWLKQHMKMHRGEESYQCKYCSRAFSDLESLALHTRRKHMSTRPFKCSECEASYCTRDELNHHCDTHSLKNCYPCSVCSATFRHPDHLKKHMTIHSAERPHVCKVCSRSFRRPSKLLAHMKKHTKGKVYQCEKCGAFFATKMGLSFHLGRIHSSGRPLSCQVCNCRFVVKSDLERHMAQHIVRNSPAANGKEPAISEETTEGVKTLLDGTDTRSCVDIMLSSELEKETETASKDMDHEIVRGSEAHVDTHSENVQDKLQDEMVRGSDAHVDTHSENIQDKLQDEVLRGSDAHGDTHSKNIQDKLNQNALTPTAAGRILSPQPRSVINTESASTHCDSQEPEPLKTDSDFKTEQLLPHKVQHTTTGKDSKSCSRLRERIHPWAMAEFDFE